MNAAIPEGLTGDFGAIDRSYRDVGNIGVSVAKDALKEATTPSEWLRGTRDAISTGQYGSAFGGVALDVAGLTAIGKAAAAKTAAEVASKTAADAAAKAEAAAAGKISQAEAGAAAKAAEEAKLAAARAQAEAASAALAAQADAEANNGVRVSGTYQPESIGANRSRRYLGRLKFSRPQNRRRSRTLNRRRNRRNLPPSPAQICRRH